jgi:N-acyl-D-amino-acid deacylase
VEGSVGKADAGAVTVQEAAGESVLDLLIVGGTVYDGTGAEGIAANVGIRDDRIVAVGDLTGAHAGRVVDARGKVVAPGFIDIHTHSDVSVWYDTGQASALAMGVTTQVVGNCGLSLGFATTDAVFEFEKRWLAPHGARIHWSSYAEHLQLISERGIGTNFLPLAGHGTLRKRVMGMEERAASAADLATMCRELDQAMEAGAWGLSSGLEYTPSSYADVTELTELCRVVGRYGGLYATHLRSEGDTLVEAVQEALNVAEGACVPLQLSHHKAEGRANWGKVATTLRMVTEARARGLDVQLDQYPYTAFMTRLEVQVLPPTARTGSNAEILARLADPASRAAILSELRRAHPDWEDLSADSPWENVRIGVCRARPEIQGRSVAALAREAGRNPVEWALDLLIETQLMVSAVNFAIGEENIAEVMRYPYTSIGSDAVATHPQGTAKDDRIHPRTYGTFARVLGRYARDLGVLTTAQAIHKMTGLPSARLGLVGRGLLQPGCYADLVVYDPQTIADLATFDMPHRYAAGVELVLVNGRVALEQGEPTAARAGTLLRRT